MKQTSPVFFQDLNSDDGNHVKTGNYTSFNFENNMETQVEHHSFNISSKARNSEQDTVNHSNIISYERKIDENLEMNCWNAGKNNVPDSLENGFNENNNRQNQENNTLSDSKLITSFTKYKITTVAKIYPFDVRQSSINNDELKNDFAALNKETNNSIKDLNVTLPSLTRKILTWPSGPWEDGPRRSAFQPYKPATVLTNLQRGNIQAKTPQLDITQCTWHMKAGRGDIRVEDIMNVLDINEKDEFGMTGLMWSAAYGQTMTVQRLLERGCDPKLRGNSQQTALHMAAYGGHHEIIKLLITYGADVNAKDGDGNTPIMYAVYEDHPHAVQELLLGDADIYILNFDNVMPYKLAIERNCNQAKLVIENHMINQLSNGISA